MKKTWVVVADSSRAKIYQMDGARGPLEEVEALVHPEARVHDQQLTSDLPGRAFDSSGMGGRHAMEPPTTPKEIEAMVFAREVCSRVKAARVNGEAENFIIAAAPSFLGLIRNTLDAATKARVTVEIDKNLVRMKPEEIRSHLPSRF
jgi:protein required for attachment to host cells